MLIMNNTSVLTKMLKSLEILGNTELRRFSESRKKRQRYLNKRGRSRKWKIRPGSALCR